jgi:hypothetical protein
MADLSTAAPENPFPEGGGQLVLTAPFDTELLHTELLAACPAITSTAMRAPGDPAMPASASNPAWLHWDGGAPEAAVREVVAAHDPTRAQESSRKIAGSELARQRDDLKERLAAGDVLDQAQLSTAVALLLGVVPPGPPAAV